MGLIGVTYLIQARMEPSTSSAQRAEATPGLHGAHSFGMDSEAERIVQMVKEIATMGFSRIFCHIGLTSLPFVLVHYSFSIRRCPTSDLQPTGDSYLAFFAIPVGGWNWMI